MTTSDGDRSLIECRRLGKRYLRTTGSRLRRGPARDRPEAEVWALRDVDLDVEPGTAVGVLGRNGAGKSTLLRLMAGVGRPDEGSVAVRGRVSALLDLGGDFRADLTGRDNARLAGLVAGLRRRAVEDLLEDVVAFAQLEDVIDAPLRTYSSGMQARLAFAVATHVLPDVLLIDEVLAVGDLAFRARCLDRIQRFRDAGATIVIVSHEPALIRTFCDRAVWLDAGRLVSQGLTGEVLERYVEAMGAQTLEQTPSRIEEEMTEGGVQLRARDNRFGTQKATVRSVRFHAAREGARAMVLSGAGLTIVLEIDAPPSLGPVQVAVVLRRADGLACIESGVLLPSEDRQSGIVECVLTIDRVDVAPGAYALDAGVWSEDWQTTHDLHAAAYPLAVVGDAHPEAVLAPPMTWSHRSVDRGVS